MTAAEEEDLRETIRQLRTALLQTGAESCRLLLEAGKLHGATELKCQKLEEENARLRRLLERKDNL